MITNLIGVALRQRLLVLIAALGLAAWGVTAYQKLPIDAFPDVAPVQVLVSMRAPGLPPEELERRVTWPIEIAMRGIPDLVKMRSITRFSVALMTFEFASGTDISGLAPRSTSACRRCATSCQPDRRAGWRRSSRRSPRC